MCVYPTGEVIVLSLCIVTAAGDGQFTGAGNREKKYCSVQS